MRERWITGLLVVLTLLLAIGLAIVVRTGPSSVSQTVRWTGVAAPLPPEMAVQKAQERAAAWAPDAVLVRVEASFRPSTRWLEAYTLPVTWLFTYFSPSARALATVGVNAERLFWIPPQEVLATPQMLPAFPPPYGVDKMWLTFQGTGGKEFLLKHPDAVVHIALQMENGAPVWLVSAIGEGGVWSVRLNAETGIVLP